MKKTLVLLGLLSCVGLMAWQGDTAEIRRGTLSLQDVLEVNKSTGPPSCVAGDPPNYANCTTSGCHDDGVANTGTAHLSLDLGGAEGGYEPGKTYTITISVSKTGIKRAGFQITAVEVKDASVSPGIVILTDTKRTQLIDKDHVHSGDCPTANKVWIEHTYDGISVPASGTNTWTYQWQAPDTAAGSITFYLAGLESNNDLTESGDHAYTTQKTIQPGTVGMAKFLPEASFRLYPNPAREYFNIAAQGNSEILHSELTDLSGRFIKSWPKNYFTSQPGKDFYLPLNGVAPGTYLLRLYTVKGSWVKKVVVE